MDNSLIPDFHIPSAIYIRQNLLQESADILKDYTRRAVLITTSADYERYSHQIDELASYCSSRSIGCIVYDELSPSPNTEEIDDATTFSRKTYCDTIIGFGGPESLSAAKAVSLLLTNELFCHDMLKGIVKPSNPPVTFISFPAYPCFGLEIAPYLFAQEIHSLSNVLYRNDSVFPTATLIDPQLTFQLDEETFIAHVMASLDIATESVIARNTNDIVNTFSLKTIDFIFRNMMSMYRNPRSYEPRHALFTASLMSGIAFSLTGLSGSLAVGLAVSSRSPKPLTTVMNVVLPHIMEFNLTTEPGKYVQMSKVMGEEVRDITVIEAAIKAVEAIRKLQSDVEAPQRLSSLEIDKELFKDISEIAVSYTLLDNSPRPFDINEIEALLIAAY